MKILYIGDLHCGVKKDDPWMERVIKAMFNQAIKYSIDNDIKIWIQTGDFFDVRRAITHRTMEFVRTEINPLLETAGIKMYVIPGNHDIMLKNKIQPNAPRELLASYDWFHIADTPQTIVLDGTHIDLVPWMCDENAEEILDFVRTSSSDVCVGHWELAGFNYYKNIKSTGYEPDFLKSYKRVISGHFHTQSSAGNVAYIGTPYTITSGDENEQRGFWEHDLSKDVMTFIPNEKMYHVRLNYPGPIDTATFENCSVRLVVTEVDKDLAKVEADLSAVAHELKIVNKSIMIDNSNSASTDFQVQSVMQMIEEQIQNCNLDTADKESTQRIARSLYVEAVNMK